MKTTWKSRFHVLWTSFWLHCPNCGQGRTFTGLFSMNKTCPVCGVRYEREDGESVGGMYINLALAELFTVGGYFVVNALFHPPFEPHLLFWVIFNVSFVTLFYRHARSLWIGISYLTGGVRADADSTQERSHSQN